MTFYGTCGRFPESEYLDDRIVGGTPTKEHEVPWIASLWKDENHHCGGSLITRQHVLTAAHCLGKGIEPENLKVHLGAWSLLNPDINSIQIVGVEELIVHNQYKSSRSRNLPENDIAIVKLDQEVRISEKVWPICLPTASVSQSTIGTVIVAGWGTTSFGGDYSDTLRKVNILTHGEEVCSRAFSGRKILPTHLCAGFLGGGKDACQGDSGGPLYTPLTSGIEPRWTLLGIVSGGEGCARKNKLGIYTRVSEYLDWIKLNLDDGLPDKDGKGEGAASTQPFVIPTSTTTQPPVVPTSITNQTPVVPTSTSFQPLAVPTRASKEQMSPCMQCICQGSTGCSNQDIRGSFAFGAFGMEKGYWLDGGRNRVPGDISEKLDEVFKRCAEDMACAIKTVQSYIAQYKRNCNSDVALNCDDFARLHRGGPGSCKKSMEGTDYWKRYSRCKSSLRTSDLDTL